ncbi:TaqI-like C-terminal specificity domain-containing protein [Treponema denticola]|uniref:TaqI-like C-terminal specificity domain-containing protein n=1 Tax=Treponema denticola TaxID=158 RepID=UPI00264841D9|nr:TaqI-like C-terminal specificity domain-containing protein [Treponema denticola]
MECLKDRSGLAKQAVQAIKFPKNGNNWVILSDIEQRIKQKIEAVGTPLKEWNIKIYRGILTGCNEAFIINKEKRDELIKKCPKSAEIIRPILRGRDIKRYSYDFAELYLLNVHNGIREKNIPLVNIDDYPAIKTHLDQYWDKISVRDDRGKTPILRGKDIKKYGYNFADKYLITTFPSKKYNIEDYPAVRDYLLNFGKSDTEYLSQYGNDCWGKNRLAQSGNKGSRKKTHNKWFELQDSIAYWDDFSKQKIIYPNMTKYLPFVFDDKNFFVNQKCFIITGQYIGFLTAFFNSSLFKYCFRDNFPELQGGTRELSKIFFETIPVIAIDDKIETNFLNAVKDIQNNYTHAKAILLDKMIFELYKLNQQEQNEIGFREIK